ncbi:MAG: DMT family transporter [Burkholderiaceae bacterium]
MRGIALIVAAVFTFSIMEAMVKWLARSYPVPLIVWARYFTQALLMVALLGPRVGARLVRTRRPGLQAIRGVMLGLSSMLFFSSLVWLPLADASAIAAVTPILVTVLAIRFLGERAPRGTWWALAISFVGVLFVVRPGSAVFQWAALLPLANAFSYAGYQLATRRLAGVDDGVSTLFIGTVVAAAVTSVVVPFLWHPPQSAADALMFVAIGAFGGVGHMLLVRAYEQASATLLAPFAYVHIVFALALGMVVFGNFPDSIALAGMALIAVTGAWMAMRQRVPIGPVEE